jgi:ribosome-binding factor A
MNSSSTRPKKRLAGFSMSRRLEKVSALIQQYSARVLTQEFPVRGAVLSITRVDLSPDLKNVRIYIGIVGKEPVSLRARINKAAPGVIAAYLGRHTDLRSVPHIRIVFDDSGEYAERLSRLIDDAATSQE